MKSNPLSVGDRVAYARGFLQRIGAFTGEMPHAPWKNNLRKAIITRRYHT